MAYYDRHEASAESMQDFETIPSGLLRISELEDEISSWRGQESVQSAGESGKRSSLLQPMQSQMPLKQAEGRKRSMDGQLLSGKRKRVRLFHRRQWKTGRKRAGAEGILPAAFRWPTARYLRLAKLAKNGYYDTEQYIITGEERTKWESAAKERRDINTEI